MRDSGQPAAVVHHGDCRAVLPTLAPGSVHAIVTDPPYGLAFMGAAWDRAVPGPEYWRAAFAALPPGGHCLAFGGTRTWHRLAVALEDAGFEIRDTVMWLYGTGFPKSTDVSKAIDRRGGNAHLTAEIGAALKVARKARGISISQADRTYCGGVTLWSWYEGRPAGQQMPTFEVLSRIAGDWPELQPYADRIAEAPREVIGRRAATRLAVAPSQGEDRSSIVTLDITAPATVEAATRAGWGTALKPAWEPVIVARRPLVGTVAANVLAHGTGALNIDGCRVDGGGRSSGGPSGKRASADEGFGGGWEAAEDGLPRAQGGRWPANVAHDGSPEVLAGFPNSGSAARFFYMAKAAPRERRDAAGHTTQKPINLLRWLVRLVTPPGGVVCDPFAGSGTTGVAAIAEGFGFVGVEIEERFARAARLRCAMAARQVRKMREAAGCER